MSLKSDERQQGTDNKLKGSPQNTRQLRINKKIFRKFSKNHFTFVVNNSTI